MATVKLEGIQKIYDNGFVAVHPTTFTIRDGEFLVLVGPSGCGKSTMLRMIAGLEGISAGNLYIGDRRVNDVEPKDRDIAMVFQNYALYPHMSIYDNMAFGLKLRKFSKEEIDKRVRQASAILGLDSMLDRKPKQLSGGQRQRVAVGRAIVRKPQVFLFDEPLSNLDAKLRVQMRTEISKLHNQLGATMVYVTHDQVEAMTMGDRIVVLKDGVVQQINTPLNLYNHPVNRFVAGFIGSPSMNFIDGKITDKGAGFVDAAGTAIATDPSDLSLLSGKNGQDVVVGIRPEHLSLVPGDGGATAAIPVTVEVVEPMGNEIVVYGRTAANVVLVGRVEPGSPPIPGQKLNFYANRAKLHYFDAQTELALRPQPEMIEA